MCGQNAANGVYQIDNTGCDTGLVCELNYFLDYNANNVPVVSFCEPEFDDPLFFTEQAPGDICTNDTECYGDGYCQNNICQPPNPNIGAACNTSFVCAVGQYCQASSSTCQPLNVFGQACSISDQFSCQWGSMCLVSPGKTSGTCTKLFSMDNGIGFQASFLNYGVFFPSLFCKSGVANYTETTAGNAQYYCTPGPIAITSTSTPLPPGSMCYYKYYTSASQEVSGNYPAQCGYNQDNMTYCTSLWGGSKFQTYLQTLQAAMSNPDVKCHIYTDILGLQIAVGFVDCASFQANYGSKNQLMRQAGYEISEGSYAVANNPTCVKQAITSYYWSSVWPPSDSNAGILAIGGAFVSLLAFIF